MCSFSNVKHIIVSTNTSFIFGISCISRETKVYAILSRNPIFLKIRAFGCKILGHKILPVYKKWQISGMFLVFVIHPKFKVFPVIHSLLDAKITNVLGLCHDKTILAAVQVNMSLLPFSLVKELIFRARVWKGKK